MEVDVGPKIIVVNFAHTDLPLKADGPWFRVVGVFRSNDAAREFSKKFTKEYGIDCYKIPLGAQCPIPSTKQSMKDPTYLAMRLDTIREHHKQVTDAFHKEFLTNRKEYATKKTKIEELRYAQNQTKKLLRSKNEDKKAAAELLKKNRVSGGKPSMYVSNKFKEEFKGLYQFFTISYYKDPSIKREHAIQIHSFHRECQEAKDHMDVLEKKTVTNDIDVMEMYGWIKVELRFNKYLMEQIPRKYRDPIKNELMQYQLIGKKLKKKEIDYEHTKLTGQKAKYVTIEPDLPDYTLDCTKKSVPIEAETPATTQDTLKSPPSTSKSDETFPFKE